MRLGNWKGAGLFGWDCLDKGGENRSLETWKYDRSMRNSPDVNLSYFRFSPIFVSDRVTDLSVLLRREFVNSDI